MKDPSVAEVGLGRVRLVRGGNPAPARVRGAWALQLGPVAPTIMPIIMAWDEISRGVGRKMVVVVRRQRKARVKAQDRGAGREQSINSPVVTK